MLKLWVKPGFLPPPRVAFQRQLDHNSPDRAMTLEICLGDIVVNALAFLAIAFVSCLVWLAISDWLKKGRRRRQRERQAKEK
jgi:hypothetical protein